MQDLKPSAPMTTTPSRRRFLVASLATAASAAVFTQLTPSHAQPTTAAESMPMPGEFIEVSQLLTGHALQAALGERAWQALLARENDFAARFQLLQQAIQQSRLHDFSQWPDSPLAADRAFKSTALAIVSAWYLGVVGEVKDRAEDGPAFITYESALMWGPTSDVTVIPTYARGGPGYWQAKPASIATD